MDTEATGVVMVRLSTASEVPALLVRTVSPRLARFMKEDPVCFYDFVMYCRDPLKYRIVSELTKAKLREYGFAGVGGEIRSEVRAIVLASTEGEGFNLKLVDPVRGVS